MIVAITAKGQNLDCHVKTRFGRAEQILIVDTNTGLWETHDNSNTAQVNFGAGVQAGGSAEPVHMRFANRL